MDAVNPPGDRYSARLRIRLVCLTLIERVWSAKLILALAALETGAVVFGGPAWKKVSLPTLVFAIVWMYYRRRLRRATRPLDLPRPDGVDARSTNVPEVVGVVEAIMRELEFDCEQLVVHGGSAIEAHTVSGEHVLSMGFASLAAMPHGELRSAVAEAITRERCLGRGAPRRAQHRYRMLYWSAEASLIHDTWWSTASRRFYPWIRDRYAETATLLVDRYVARADADTADAAGAEAAVAAALRQSRISQLLGEAFWPAVWASAAEVLEPPDDVYLQMASFLADHVGEGDSPTVEIGRLAGTLGALWAESMREDWLVEHAAVSDARRRQTDLAGEASYRALSPDEALEHAVLTEAFDGDAAARDAFEGLLVDDPRDPRANFSLGRILLAEGDDGGLAHLDVAMEEDETAVLFGCELAVGFLERFGRPDEASVYRERWEAHVSRLKAATEERGRLRHDDTLLPPDTTSDLIPLVLAELRPLKEVKRAFLVRKQVEINPDSAPLHMLFVVRGGSTLRLDREDASTRLMRSLYRSLGALPGLQIRVYGSSNKLDRRVRETPGALVFTRGRVVGIDVRGIVAPAMIGAFSVDFLVGHAGGASSVAPIAAVAAAAAIAVARCRSLAGRPLSQQ